MKQLADLTPTQLKSIERTLAGGTWTITAGAILFSVLTVTPLVQRVTSERWDWTAPILPIVVDAAVVIVIRLDATVSRLGEDGGRWPTFLRWLTGCMTLALNIGDSALKGDKVGVAVHSVAPLLLIVTAEAALAYRRAISRALERIESERRKEAERRRREQHEERERERRERHEREQREREEREARERSAREQREHEEAARERREREAREHQLAQQREQREAEREQREFEAKQERERAERVQRERREREERERRDQAEREERARLEKERREQEERAKQEREREERERQAQERRARREQSAAQSAGVRGSVRAQRSRPSANTSKAAPANTSKDKMEEPEARAAIVSGVAEGAGVRELARRTGWSLAWVSERVHETRGEQAGDDAHEQSGDEQPAAELTGAGVR